MFPSDKRTVGSVRAMTTDPVVQRWIEIGQRVEARRLDLGLTQQEAATAAGIGSTTWRLLEKGQQHSFRPMTMRSISKALGWMPDSIQRMLRGEEPRLAIQQSTFPEFDEADYNSRIARMSDHTRQIIDAIIADEERRR